MSTVKRAPRSRLFRELTLFLVLLLCGLVLLPIAVFVTGRMVFGDYAGAGFAAFWSALHAALFGGNLAAWYLILSPYLIWQLARLTVLVFRRRLRPTA